MMPMHSLFAFASCLALTLTLLAPASLRAQSPPVRTGIEVLREQGFDILRGKRVGLITNPTGVDRTLLSTIDILAAAPDVNLVALFGPEHGVRGDYAAGDEIAASTDDATGVPVFSLYGPTRKPTEEMLKNVDVLVYDIQDIGCRSYTFISTMGLAMEAAADHGIPFVVLDRPNPLGGERMEGRPVEDGYRSFVSQYPIPYVYGLTCGELALLLNGEGLLEGERRCDLKVIPMEGWKRSMVFEDTGLPWVPTSPHVPHPWSPLYYVASGVLGELGIISEGVGYTLPFQLLAAEWINPLLLADSMNALRLPGILFRPVTFVPFYGRDAGKRLHGVQIHILDPHTSPLLAVQFHFLHVHQTLYPDRNPFRLAQPSRLDMFDKVCGTDRIRRVLADEMKAESALEELESGVREFRTRAAQYLLY